MKIPLGRYLDSRLLCFGPKTITYCFSAKTGLLWLFLYADPTRAHSPLLQQGHPFQIKKEVTLGF